ncbi:preprotein translocase subunit YajC [Rhodococcus sp. PAMC28707]|uniref:preprotein translocase subunit YajC n=1 Tax=unclassified Rhodococcus (in: high G+C Gram-positive bacteria) TaxID=192944 RepID=UPI00109DC8DA|nr:MULTISPECIES: preprotein translocase subunit YajC [unclassified Rhodococcus (in: high G+C Gram-positive bacteria)]QCB51029.1 preprotein translocase subunit YajC [Rhodococcus sp. PAMC28705]QCB57279.1 preprotein translocase subunit YajC [Rhodococcus sp. PAMC28707]
MELLFPLLIVALLVPMFLNVRRQKKALAQTQTLQDSLKIGDEVVTTAGLYARVVLVEDDTVDLEIADGIVTTWSRAVVKEVLPPDVDDLDSDFVGSVDVIESGDSTPSLEKSTTLEKDASPSSSEETVEQSARRLEKE